MVALAQYRERVRQMEAANKADQKRIVDTQFNTSRSNDPAARSNQSFEIGGIQMQIARRGQEMRTARDEIEKLEERLGLKATAGGTKK